MTSAPTAPATITSSRCLSMLSAAKGAGALEVAWAETERVFEAEGEPFDGIGPELKSHYRQLRAKVS